MLDAEKVLTLLEAGRVPAPGDNAAIAIRRLDAGSRVDLPGGAATLPFTVPEGHRFAMAVIEAGEPLLSWGLPFGLATRRIVPGEYLANDKTLGTLRQRQIDFALPPGPNFKDHFAPFQLDEGRFLPGEQVPRYPQPGVFDGFARAGGRGAGTRNYIAVVGTSSRTASFARALAERFKDAPRRFPNVDGVVAVAHTEGGGLRRPNNEEFLLRALAGFLVHPNLGAVLAADVGAEPVNNAVLRQFMREGGYPLDAVLHEFMSLPAGFDEALSRGAALIESWLPRMNEFVRTPQPLAQLKIGLQCGGSDAFSGVSGNPLAGIITRELVRHGGSANLAETDELIGAESYVLANVRDLETARAFLRKRDEFAERLSWHGLAADTNPSGGNVLRGLYNIAIKSIGAARKKDPAARLDYVIGYAEPMREPGFYFMDSPGNDLESIAGQVASGCNLIVFTTGNGSITNFPFVPTIKVMTNTGRFNLLQNEMDFNAGRYLDGEPLEALGAEAFDYAMRVASGQRSVGERAGHAQVQLWREWRQTDRSKLEQLRRAPRPSGKPVSVRPEFTGLAQASLPPVKLFLTERGPAADRIGLIVPTSLCAGQVGRLIAEQLNARAPDLGVTCFVALPHTEGCGVSGEEGQEILQRTLAGYLSHPSVARALLLEHGCEKTHNDAFRNFLAAHGQDASRFGFASIQLDGGIEKVTARVTEWFRTHQPAAAERRDAGLGALRLGVMAEGAVTPAVAGALATVAGVIVRAGGWVVVPQNSALWQAKAFRQKLFGPEPSATPQEGGAGLRSSFSPSPWPSPQGEGEPVAGLTDEGVPLTQAAGNGFSLSPRERAGVRGNSASDEPQPSHPTLAYGEPAAQRGLHVMETPTDHPVETLTGLGATGVEVILALVKERPLPAHPFIPMLQVGTSGQVGPDLDFALALEAEREWPSGLLARLAQVASGAYRPKLSARGATDFQMTRGWLGIST
jgi:altronate dehydratase